MVMLLAIRQSVNVAVLMQSKTLLQLYLMR